VPVESLIFKAGNMSLQRAQDTLRKPQARSRVTNGKDLLAGVDGRKIWARRMRDLIGLHTADLGGVDGMSAAEKSIVRRAATLTVELERLEGKFAEPGEASAADIDLYQRTANSLRRLLESVGLQRRARDVTPSLAVECARIVAERETKTSTGVVSDENHTEPACGGAA